jgi:hypothetical protein
MWTWSRRCRGRRSRSRRCWWRRVWRRWGWSRWSWGCASEHPLLRSTAAAFSQEHRGVDGHRTAMGIRLQTEPAMRTQHLARCIVDKVLLWH